MPQSSGSGLSAVFLSAAFWCQDGRPFAIPTLFLVVGGLPRSAKVEWEVVCSNRRFRSEDEDDENSGQVENMQEEDGMTLEGEIGLGAWYGMGEKRLQGFSAFY